MPRGVLIAPTVIQKQRRPPSPRKKPADNADTVATSCAARCGLLPVCGWGRRLAVNDRPNESLIEFGVALLNQSFLSPRDHMESTQPMMRIRGRPCPGVSQRATSRSIPVGLHLGLHHHLGIENSAEVGEFFDHAAERGDRLTMEISEKSRVIGILQIQLLHLKHP